MKILFGIGIWWWNANAYYAASVAEVLQQNQHDVMIAARESGLPFEHSKKMGLPVSHIDLDTTNPFMVIRELFRLKKLVEEYKPDILFPATSKAQFLMVLVKIFFFRNIKLVRILADVQSPSKTITNRWFYKRWIDWVIASSEVSKKRVLANTGFDENRISVIYLGYDIDRFYQKFEKNSIYKKYQIPESRPVILNIARLTRTKAQPVFLEALAILKNKNIEFSAVISGEAVDFSIIDLSKMAQKVMISESVIFLDRVADVRELIAIGDFGVISSISSEVVCRIATEYLIYGLPVIGTDVNVIPEMIKSDINGYIVAPDDPEDLALALEKAISDKTVAKQIGEENYKLSRKKYDYKQFYSLINEVLTILK